MSEENKEGKNGNQANGDKNISASNNIGFVPINLSSLGVQNNNQGKAENNINHTALQKLIGRAENKKGKGSNPVFDYYETQAKEKAISQAEEMRVTSYAEVKSDFERIFGKEAKGGLTSIENIYNVNDKTEYLARAIIKKAFPADKEIEGLLQNRDISVLDKKGALYVRYKDALKHFNKEGKTTSAFYAMNKKNISKETLEKIQCGLYDYKYKGKAKDMAKNLGILK